MIFDQKNPEKPLENKTLDEVFKNTNSVLPTSSSVSSTLHSITAPKEEKDFGSYDVSSTQKAKTLKLRISIPSAILWITLSLLIWLIFLSLAYINIWSDTNNPNHYTTVSSYKNTVLAIDEIIWFPGITNEKTNLTTITDISVKNVIASSIPFIFKKDIIEETVSGIILSILTHNRTLQELTQEITKYWFIHPDVMSLLEKNKDQIPIMVSLHTLETIKFGTALKIFSMLDTFLQQWSQVLNVNKNELSDLMDSYTIRWERDIANYLSMCYLNPYEKFPDCSQIWDFNNYFLYEDKESTLDTALFGKIFALLDTKLEKSTVPSLQIDFDRFDPNATNIWFRVTVNTLAEDDVAFMARGILNPHVFIISTLVKLLRQSLFVIWDSINIDKLNIKQQNITVGNIQVPVNTSFMSFDLPLQNSSQREIFDFYDTH